MAPINEREQVNKSMQKSKEVRRQIETLFRKRPQPKVDQLT